MIVKKISKKEKRTIPFLIVILLGLPLPLLHPLLSIGGKSFLEFAYLFLIGYYVLSNEENLNKIENERWLLFGIGLVATLVDVYLFMWSSKELSVINSAAKYISEWVMVLALIGLAKRYLNFNNKLFDYMKNRSFLFYIYHFIWVVAIQYLLLKMGLNNGNIIFLFTVILAYILTFLSCEISIRIPVLCILTGVKYKRKQK